MRLIDDHRDCARAVYVRAVVIVELMLDTREHPVLVLVRLLELCPQEVLGKLKREDLDFLLVPQNHIFRRLM